MTHWYSFADMNQSNHCNDDCLIVTHFFTVFFTYLYTRIPHSPNECDSRQDLQAGGASGTAQSGDSLNGQASGDIRTFCAIAENRGHRALLVHLVIHNSGGGQSGGEQHGAHNEDLHFDLWGFLVFRIVRNWMGYWGPNKFEEISDGLDCAMWTVERS